MSVGGIELGQLVGRLLLLDVACSRCPRRGRLRLSRLIEQHGASAALPVLKDVLAGDCPRLRETSIYDRCGVHFPQLPALFPAK